MADLRSVSTEHSHIDPFYERQLPRFSVRKRILGVSFRFESVSEELLSLVEAAYGGLPEYRWPVDCAEQLIELRLVARTVLREGTEPPQMTTQSGADLLCGIVDESNYVIVAAQWQRALIVVSQDMLAYSYHVRYEFIEFAVYLLAARGLGLVPLHGACIGRNGRGILLLGERGAGKSTLCLHGMLHGFELLAEDAVFVHPESLLAVGVPNYLHVRSDALRFVDTGLHRRIGDAPIIRRRSGEEKFEVDARKLQLGLSTQPLKIAATVFASNHPAKACETLLNSVPVEDVGSRLRDDQPYAAHQPGWNRFEAALTRLGAYQLCRGNHPADSIDAIQHLLERNQNG